MEGREPPVPVTIRALANKCGLSVATVSKALNGYTDISEATREAVEKAAKEMGYYPNAHARALKYGKSYNLGVLFADDTHSGLTHAFFSEVLESFKKEAESAGFDITFISHNLGTGRITYEEHCHYRQIDGICIAAVNFADKEIQNLFEGTLPIVSIDNVCGKWPCVFSDNDTGMSLLVRYIAKRGHRKIAYIHGQDGESTRQRLSAFKRTMEQLHLQVPEVYIRPSHYTDPEHLQKVFTELMKMEDRPTCVICSDDFSAYGAFGAAETLGLRIPEDVSIAGFDGIAAMKYMHPHLTSVRQDTDKIGRDAARRLISLVEVPSQPSRGNILVPCSLVEGETVRKI